MGERGRGRFLGGVVAEGGSLKRDRGRGSEGVSGYAERVGWRRRWVGSQRG